MFAKENLLMFCLCETGGEGGAAILKLSHKWKKVRKCFQIFCIKKYLSTFRKIQTRGGGCDNFKVVSQRQNMSKFYYGHIPKKRKSDIWKKGRFIIMTHMRYKEESHLWWFCGIKAKNLKKVKKGRFMKQNHRKLKEKNVQLYNKIISLFFRHIWKNLYKSSY